MVFLRHVPAARVPSGDSRAARPIPDRLDLVGASLGGPVAFSATLDVETVVSLGFAIFVFTMAVGQDYNILVMSRIHEVDGRGAAFREAPVGAVDVTGGIAMLLGRRNWWPAV